MKNFNLLDCTLRDGGYYNNWNFSISEANKYLKSVYNSKVDIVEIGFRFLKLNKKNGFFAFVNAHVIKNIIKSKRTKLAVMINADELISKKANTVLNKKFKSDLHGISIIRIAIHFKDLNKIEKYLIKLKTMGFKICLNLMQINNVSEKDLSLVLKRYNKNFLVDVFYFADSFGNLKPRDVKKICNVFKKNWNKDFGIHAHDNCGLALKNSIQAYKSGATWIDGTIQGMGRGAGNVKTEDLIKYFSNSNYDLSSLKQSSTFFLKLKDKYHWGKSKNYKLAAKHNIHPSYIQALEADNRFNKSSINKIVFSLSKIESKKYDPRLLEKISIEKKYYKGKWDALDWCKNKNLLILGQGDTLKNKNTLKKIKNYISINKPLVLCVNLNNNIPKNLVDYYVSANEMRMFVDHNLYTNLKKSLIIPLKKYKKVIKKSHNIKVLDYGVKIEDNKFLPQKNYVTLPNNQSFGYVLGLAVIGKAKSIFLAGFDGYSKGHVNQESMLKIIHLFIKKFKKTEIRTLTKSLYPIKTIKI